MAPPIAAGGGSHCTFNRRVRIADVAIQGDLSSLRLGVRRASDRPCHTSGALRSTRREKHRTGAPPEPTRQYAPSVFRLALTSASIIVAAAFAVSSASARLLPGFRSPSGNIRCFVLAGHSGDLLCTIAAADYTKTLQARCIDAGAGVEWHGFTLGATRRAALNCSGGIQYDPATDRLPIARLAYGSTWRSGDFSCSSSRTGVTCRNHRGHGLFVSRASWRAW
jgi:hypothetical protein